VPEKFVVMTEGSRKMTEKSIEKPINKPELVEKAVKFINISVGISAATFVLKSIHFTEIYIDLYVISEIAVLVFANNINKAKDWARISLLILMAIILGHIVMNINY